MGAGGGLPPPSPGSCPLAASFPNALGLHLACCFCATLVLCPLLQNKRAERRHHPAPAQKETGYLPLPCKNLRAALVDQPNEKGWDREPSWPGRPIWNSGKVPWEPTATWVQRGTEQEVSHTLWMFEGAGTGDPRFMGWDLKPPFLFIRLHPSKETLPAQISATDSYGGLTCL